MLPEIQTIQTKDNIISKFQGLNQKDTSNDEMFKDMLNMTSDEYPYLYPREKSAIREVFSGNLSLIYGSCVYGEDLYTVQGQRVSGVDTLKFYKNFEEVSSVTLTQQLYIRDLVVYGANIVIFPDNIMYNTQNNTVTNLDYTLNISNTSSYLYLSDKNGVPFMCDDTTSFTYKVDGSTSYTQNGFYGVLLGDLDDPYSDLDNATYPAWDADLRIHNSIKNNSTYFDLTKFVPRRHRERDGGTGDPAELLQANLIYGKKWQITEDDAYTKYTTYNCFYGTVNSNGQLSIQQYNRTQNMFTPAELYVSYLINYTTYAQIKDKVKVGDFVKITGLKSNNAEYSETDYKGKPAYWNIVNTFNNRLKVENIIECASTDSNKVILVFSNNTLKFDDALIEANRVYSGKYTTPEKTIKYIKKINNTLGFGWGDMASSIVNHAKLEKKPPSMIYITVSQNRIWGCSSVSHEIYACKQGDPSAWYNYAGLSSDSYAVTIPNGDPFTGAITYNDMPYFFTENMAYSIMGNKPKNYQVQKFEVRGVENGASHTLAQKDGYVYYKSKGGIERFNGNNSQSVTDYLNLEGMTGFVGAVNNDKYFVFMGQDSAHTKLYVYDIKKRQWHIDRDYMPNYMAEIDNNLYLLNGTVGKVYLEKINGKSKEVAPILTDQTIDVTYDTPKWYVESGEFNGESVLNKYITKFMFELRLEEGANLSISFMYDDSGEWERVFRTTDSHTKKLIKVPISVRRCERMRYKIEGEGMAKIYTITITFEGGSEIG